MTNQFSGRPFKVFSENTGTVLAEFDRLQDAQTYADEAHRDDTSTHFQIVEIKWCGGSKRLSDLDRRAV
jgi:hypothetical protein